MATRILDVIMIDYPVKVRPMPGMWVQWVPVTAIPWGRMKTEQRNLVCVYYCSTYYKAVREGGGGGWRTCAT